MPPAKAPISISGTLGFNAESVAVWESSWLYTCPSIGAVQCGILYSKNGGGQSFGDACFGFLPLLRILNRNQSSAVQRQSASERSIG